MGVIGALLAVFTLGISMFVCPALGCTIGVSAGTVIGARLGFLGGSLGHDSCSKREMLSTIFGQLLADVCRLGGLCVNTAACTNEWNDEAVSKLIEPEGVEIDSTTVVPEDIFESLLQGGYQAKDRSQHVRCRRNGKDALRNSSRNHTETANFDALCTFEDCSPTDLLRGTSTPSAETSNCISTKVELQLPGIPKRHVCP